MYVRYGCEGEPWPPVCLFSVLFSLAAARLYNSSLSDLKAAYKPGTKHQHSIAGGLYQIKPPLLHCLSSSSAVHLVSRRSSGRGGGGGSGEEELFGNV